MALSTTKGQPVGIAINIIIFTWLAFALATGLTFEVPAE